MDKKSLLSVSLAAAIIIGALTGAMPLSKAQSYTPVTGIISSNVTLTKANGPYNFTGPVIVNAGATLTIAAGATVDISSYLQVSGTLIAIGSSVNLIYFYGSGGPINFTSNSKNCVIENSIMSYVGIQISSSVTLKNNYIYGSVYDNVTDIFGGSPTISNNTLAGGLDSDDNSNIAVVNIPGGSPTISNNNIIAFVDNGLYPNPPLGMNRYGTAYGVYASNVNGAYITDNKLILAFRVAGVQVASGTATVEGNTELSYNPVSTPAPTATPYSTTLVTPTLPPYPPPSQSPTNSQSPTPIQTINTSPNQTQENFYEVSITVIIASVVINIILVVIVAFLLRKRTKAEHTGS